MPAKPAAVVRDRFEPLREAIRLAALARSDQVRAFAALEEAKSSHDRAAEYAHRAEQIVIAEIQEVETAADRDVADADPSSRKPT